MDNRRILRVNARISLRRLVVWFATAVATSATHAQSPGARTIRLIVAAPAGSSLDAVGRILAERMKESVAAPIVIENVPGAGGTLAMGTVARAPGDGHTLGIGFNGPLAFAPHLYTRLAYDPLTDLKPIALATSQPNVLAVAAVLPVKRVEELIVHARERPGALNYASVGNGSSSHLTKELMKSMARLDIVHVPYNGSPPALNALASGDAAMLFAVPTAIAPLAQAGKVRMLAVSSARRWALMPELPTVAEAGLPGFEALAWNGVVAPAATPVAIVERINRSFDQALRDAPTRAKLNAAGMEPVGGTPAAFAALIREESGSCCRRCAPRAACPDPPFETAHVDRPAIEGPRLRRALAASDARLRARRSSA
jgi:tripartite-type tricarboxylate transporter receptor subunit TctC